MSFVRKYPFVLALALAPLTACIPAVPPATVGAATLPAEKAFLTAQGAFAAAQTVAIAGIKSGAITGTFKTTVIDLLDRGASYEAAGYRGDVVAVRNLQGVVASLAALGIKGK